MPVLWARYSDNELKRHFPVSEPLNFILKIVSLVNRPKDKIKYQNINV